MNKSTFTVDFEIHKKNLLVASYVKLQEVEFPVAS